MRSGNLDRMNNIDSISTQQSSDQFLTRFESRFEVNHCNHRLLFGRPLRIIENEFIDGVKTRKTALFKPGAIFAIDLWEQNQFGTAYWAVYVLQAATPGELALPIPQVQPAAKILLEAKGKERSRKALKMLAEIEERADPTNLSPNRFLLTDFRLKAMSNSRQSRWNPS